MEDDDELITMSQVATRCDPSITWCSKAKIFNCPIHDMMRFEPLPLAVIDTPEFQRLRDLKQLGLTHYVFTGATHTRFDHSLGVGHLAHKFANNLWSTQRLELGMEEADITCVTLAGLCHDLGHGPFSHVFDLFLKELGIKGWRHESMSCEIFDLIVQRLPQGPPSGPLELSEGDVKRIKNMIDVERVPELELQDKRFLYDIVANRRNSIDVDKFDYLARDSYYCGVPISFDHNRVMGFSKVLGNQICFSSKEYINLFELFYSRQRMHRTVYSHAKAKSVEFMVVDALVEADKVFNFKDMIWDPVKFVRMNDTMLNMVVEHWDSFNPSSLPLLSEDRQQALTNAQAIIQRLRKRQLYKFVNEFNIPPGLKEEVEAKATPESLLSFSLSSEAALRASDIIFTIIKIDYSCKDKNPMDSVMFFDHSQEPRNIRQIEVSPMFMEVFQEYSLRLYSRTADPGVISALQQAFLGWKRANLPASAGVVFKTPMKAKKEDPDDGQPDRQEEPAAKRPRGLLGALDAAGGSGLP